MKRLSKLCVEGRMERQKAKSFGKSSLADYVITDAFTVGVASLQQPSGLEHHRA